MTCFDPPRECIVLSGKDFFNSGNTHQMGGGVSNPISENQRAAMHVAVLEALPSRVYALEEMRFKAGSFYDTTPDFAEQTKHVPAFSALGLHEWSISQLWRHFTTVSERLPLSARMQKNVP